MNACAKFTLNTAHTGWASFTAMEKNIFFL